MVKRSGIQKQRPNELWWTIWFDEKVYLVVHSPAALLVVSSLLCYAILVNYLCTHITEILQLY